jgi:hypothetical protein
LPPSTPLPVPGNELALLSTEDQLALVIAPTRDLRDLTLRLNPTINAIPLTLAESPADYQVGDRQEFWVHELGQNRNFRIMAELIHKTDVAYAWVEVDRPYAADPIINAVDRFSRQSYPAVVAFFGSEWNPGVDNGCIFCTPQASATALLAITAAPTSTRSWHGKTPTKRRSSISTWNGSTAPRTTPIMRLSWPMSSNT